MLDGDEVRKHLSSELGFTKEHRDSNIRRIGFVASEITKHGGISSCAPIAPFQEHGNHSKQTVFYANLDARTPLISRVIYFGMQTVVGTLPAWPLGVVSIPLAISIASISNTIYMLIQLHLRLGPMQWLHTRDFLARLAGA